MTKRRVIFPPPDYWTRPKENPVTNTDNIITTPDRVAVIVTNVQDDGSLVAGLRFDLPAPLGRIDIMLGYESAAKIAGDMARMLSLDDNQRAELLADLRARGEQL